MLPFASGLLTVLSVVLVVVPALFGLSASPLFFWGSLMAIPCVGAAGWVCCRLKRLKALLKLRERWGNQVEKDRNFEAISLLHHYLRKEPASLYAVDGQTWHDLDLA